LSYQIHAEDQNKNNKIEFNHKNSWKSIHAFTGMTKLILIFQLPRPLGRGIQLTNKKRALAQLYFDLAKANSHN